MVVGLLALGADAIELKFVKHPCESELAGDFLLQ
jgi:hypothetical protein